MNKRNIPAVGTVEISPSILSADFANLSAELFDITRGDVKMVHLDIMDGHFVPNITFGPAIVAKMRPCSDLFFDCHLMISEPAKYIKAFADAGCDHLTFHIETTDKPCDLIKMIHDLGLTAGVTLNPQTPVSAIADIASLCDMILVMTVNPGFGGQSFMPEAAKKIVELRQLAGPSIRIEVDGGINAETAAIATGYGADTLVAGNAIFAQSDRKAAIEAISTAC